MKDKLQKTKRELHEEKLIKRKLYLALTKVADQLKAVQAENKLLQSGNKYHQHLSTSGLRGVNLLPSIKYHIDQTQRANESTRKNLPVDSFNREAISLSDLFFDAVIVIAFTTVGKNFHTPETTSNPLYSNVDVYSFTCFLIFWFIWAKDTSYKTRFGPDPLSQMMTVITCFAVVFGSLSITQTPTFDSASSLSIMVMAAFVSLVHMFLNLRVWFWFKNTEISAVKQYAKWNTIMNCCEFINWSIGIYNNFCHGVIFACGILFSVRFPWMMMENDFHGEYI